MGKKFQLQVVTPEQTFFSGETDMVILKSTEGEIGILYGHVPFVAPLRVGSLRVRQEDQSFKIAACSAGFFTVNQNVVTAVVDSAEWVEEIDLERALESKRRAEERIKEGPDKGVDVLRARLALERAINRIKLRELHK